MKGQIAEERETTAGGDTGKKKPSLRHWKIVAMYLRLYDIIAVNFAYFLGLWLRFDLRFSAIPTEYWAAFLKFAPLYTAAVLLVSRAEPHIGGLRYYDGGARDWNYRNVRANARFLLYYRRYHSGGICSNGTVFLSLRYAGTHAAGAEPESDAQSHGRGCRCRGPGAFKRDEQF